MTIETKELVISEELKRKVEMICRFAYVEYEFINGNIKSIKNTNIAMVKPHIAKIKGIDYLMVDDANSVVADELLFTSDTDFFKDMNKRQIKWADTCMEFVYEDLGYTKEQILHATLHLDEKTSHIHCVVVPLIRKYDKRTNIEKYTISKKQYIKDKTHLSELQDNYYQRPIDKGFKLERGIQNSDNEHISIKEFKKITRKLDNRLEQQNYLMTRDFEGL